MAEIDVGEAAIDRDTKWGYRTMVNKGNPANADGIITSIEIWTKGTLSDVEIAIFYVVSGNNLSTRDNELIGTVTGDSKQTFNVSLDIQTGDYIGMYWSYSGGAGIEVDSTGGSGAWYLAGDNIPCTDTTFDSIDDLVFSLYGTSAAPPTVKKKNVIFMGGNF